jgi:CRISPR system Cascade subunit CasA
VHDPARSAWRGLGALVIGQSQGRDQRKDAAASLRPRVLEWIARLTTEGYLPQEHLIRARLLGAVYGTQQSVFNEMVDDGLVMAVVLLHERDERFAQAALEAAADADAAVRILGQLAADLAEASGSPADPQRESAHDVGYGALDGPYRRWLRDLTPTRDPQAARRDWQRLTRRAIAEAGERLLAGCAGDAAWAGRTVATAGGELWLNDTRADLRFRRELKKRLGQATTDDAPAGIDHAKARI